MKGKHTTKKTNYFLKEHDNKLITKKYKVFLKNVPIKRVFADMPT
jgi:hypothetical protein